MKNRTIISFPRDVAGNLRLILRGIKNHGPGDIKILKPGGDGIWNG